MSEVEVPNLEVVVTRIVPVVVLDVEIDHFDLNVERFVRLRIRNRKFFKYFAASKGMSQGMLKLTLTKYMHF